MPNQRTKPIWITRRTRENGRRTVKAVAAAWTWELAQKGLAEFQRNGRKDAVYSFLDIHRPNQLKKTDDFRYITEPFTASE
tara:strand:- start:5586 stop:5828 length:243 start_codon:yes stop_codon:yes gene_type:complete